MYANWRTWSTIAACGLLLSGLLGCPSQNFPNAIDATLADVQAIVNDTALSLQQQRDKLAALGLSQTSINGILNGQRLGNQFGGTLQTAYDKVVAGHDSTLTPDEVQLYGDAAQKVSGGPNFTISDAAAAAVVDLFVEHKLNTSADVSAFLADPTQDTPAAIPANLLQQLFVEFDPTQVNSQLP